MRRRVRRGGGRQAEVSVTGIGARGDGFAEIEGSPLFLPMTLPGERVLARLVSEQGGTYRGEVLELLDASPERAEPPCPYFGRCGGCALQHWQETPYAAWKQALVARALAQRGLAPRDLHPLRQVPPRSRRRAVFAAQREGEEVRLGYYAPRSHFVVDVAACLLLTPALGILLPDVRGLLTELPQAGDRFTITATETRSGIDLLIQGEAYPDLAARELLAAFAAAADLARLSWRRPDSVPELIAEHRQPVLVFGDVEVTPPPGGFLQPSAEGEAFLSEQVLRHLPAGGGRAADLYAGSGTFTFPLAAAGFAVTAVEGAAEAVRALDEAARKAGLAGRVSVAERDLQRRPLQPAELQGLDVVILDPPRAGAREQTALLAAARVPLVVMVSCSPTTFARDAKTLVDAGYELLEVAPLDQFPWSGHVELVGCLRLPA